jgi:branched-chain amino acid transport system permease protein
MPSFTLLGQSLISGVLAGGLYGIVALGVSLSWGLLRLLNLSYLALTFLAAYLTYQLCTFQLLPVWAVVLCIIPGFFLFGVAAQWFFDRFRVTEMSSLLISFGFTLIIESLIQWYWTADQLRFQTSYSTQSFAVGPFFIPVLSVAVSITAVLVAVSTWAWLKWTFVGKALRASAEDRELAAAFGVNHRSLSFLLSGICSVYAAIAGIFIAVIATLSPSEIWAWLGVTFAVVIVGRLGNPIGALLAGALISASEQVTMAIVNPAWASLVAFSLLIGLLLWRPRWL